MTVNEFLDKIDWSKMKLIYHWSTSPRIRTENKLCPFEVIFGKGQAECLLDSLSDQDRKAIMDAADNFGAGHNSTLRQEMLKRMEHGG